MRPHAELHQQGQSGTGHWNLKSMARLLSDWDAETKQICAELTLHDCLKPKGVRPVKPEDENREAMPRWLYRLNSLTMPPAQLPNEGRSWASAMLSLRISARILFSSMLDRRCMKPWPMTWFHHRCIHGLSDRFPEKDCRGNTLLEAKLPEEGYLDIRHLLDVKRQAWGATRATSL